MTREAEAMASESKSMAREVKLKTDAANGTPNTEHIDNFFKGPMYIDGFGGIGGRMSQERILHEPELLACESLAKAGDSECMARQFESICSASCAGTDVRNAKRISRVYRAEAKARQSEAWARLWESWARQSEYSARQSEAFVDEARDFKNFVRKCLAENEDEAASHLTEEPFETVAFDSDALTRQTEALACQANALEREAAALLLVAAKHPAQLDEREIQEIEEKCRIRMADANSRQIMAWTRQSDAIARQYKAIARQTQYKVTADEFEALTNIYLTKAMAKAKAAADAEAEAETTATSLKSEEAACSTGHALPKLRSFFASSKFKGAKPDKADTKVHVAEAEIDEINDKKAKKAKSKKGFCTLC